MVENHELVKLCNDIIALGPTIRSALIINKMGKMLAGGMREGVKSMEDKTDSQQLYVEYALRSIMREEFDEEFGKTIYTFSEREKIKLVSFPLEEKYILRVSIEKEESHHNELIEKILKLSRMVTSI